MCNERPPQVTGDLRRGGGPDTPVMREQHNATTAFQARGQAPPQSAIRRWSAAMGQQCWQGHALLASPAQHQRLPVTAACFAGG